MFHMKGQIPNDEMIYGEILRDGLFVKKGDVMAFLDAMEYDRWFNSGDGKVIRRLVFDEVQKRFGHDFVVLMSNDARLDRHVMRRFNAERFVDYYSSDFADNHVDFYRSVYQIKPTNFY